MLKSRLFLMQFFLSLMIISLVIAELEVLYCADQDSLSCSGYEPVCASYQRSCSEPPCPQDLEFPNSCAACQDSMVVSYKNGSCPRACESSDVFADCSAELIHPVCGATVDGCTTADCQQSFENSCTACTNSSIVSYKPGLCPQQSWINCSTFSHSINCEEGALVSVCATLKEDCDGVPCQATFMSPCVACLNSNVISFVPGACEEGDNLESEVLSENMLEESSTETDLADALIFCKPDRPTDCSLFDFELVCAYFLIGCPEGVCSQTEVNSCTACQLQNVESYSYGRCEQERLPCDPSNRPTLCDNTSDPVCAYLINCVNGVCSETVINSCTACMDPNVHLYVSGTC